MYREHDTTRAPKRRRTRTPNTPLDSHLWRDNLSRVLAHTGDMRAWAPASATQHWLQTCACVAASVIAQHHRSQPPTPRPPSPLKCFVGPSCPPKLLSSFSVCVRVCPRKLLDGVPLSSIHNTHAQRHLGYPQVMLSVDGG